VTSGAKLVLAWTNPKVMGAPEYYLIIRGGKTVSLEKEKTTTTYRRKR